MLASQAKQAPREVVGSVREAASHEQYRDNPVLVTMKVLEAAGMLTEKLPTRAEIAYMLDTHARGRGAVTRSVRLISDWAIEQLGIERVQILTHPENRASIAVAEPPPSRESASYGPSVRRRVGARTVWSYHARRQPPRATATG
jgi:hypothetical protein